MAIVGIMKFSREEELVANSFKILRQSIKDENNLQKTIIDYPNLINDLI